MASTEKSVVDATLLAIEEINAKGGVMGKKLKAVFADGQSTDSIFIEQAEHLITQEKVVAVFGGLGSAVRKKIKPIFEQHNHLLFYPGQHEGLEKSHNIVYLGATPNQQIIPAVKWAFENLGHKFVLVGSDYVFPRVANAIIRQQISGLGGAIEGEFYQAKNNNQFESIVKEIKHLQPDVILNLIDGESNSYFYNALRKAGIYPSDIPVLSFSLAENQIKRTMRGDYVAWNYFQNLSSPQNTAFVANIKKRFGNDKTVSATMAAAYSSVYFWKTGVERAKSTNPELVRKSLQFTSFPSPSGIVTMDSNSQHTWKTARVGKINSTLHFDVIWEAKTPTWSNPFPAFKSQVKWQQFIYRLYHSLG